MKGLDYLATLTRWDGTGEFNLTALSRVLNYFGNPQDKVPSIHVGGTNGKGSVCVTTAAIIGAAGYRCGLATSPHLSRINERIVIDGHEVDDYSLSTLALELERSCVRKKETLTYHEALTAMSFLAFFENKVDWMVVEVGLGGTLDASNVISKPEISVITTIDFDHEDILGNSLRLIAREKAGIIKNGSRVVIGPMSAEAREIILKISEEKRATVFGLRILENRKEQECDNRILKTFVISYNSCNEGSYSSDESNVEPFKFSPSLAGFHQIANTSISLKICELISINKEFWQPGINNLFWPGRLEEIKEGGATFILDAAHNEAGAREIANYLKSKDIRALTLAFGVLKTKRWKEMLTYLVPFAKQVCLLTPNSDRALPVNEINEFLSSFDIRVRSFDYDYKGFIREMTKEGGTILVCGSIYMMGGVRAELVNGIKPLWIKNIR